jgi:hypothetical protein
LKGATSVAAGLLAAPPTKGEGSTLLPTVSLGPHRITRLISGNNPIFGYSHFNRLLDRLMVEYFTDDRIIQYLLHCEKMGINTWQTGYDERLLRLLREAGWKMNWICLAAPEYENESGEALDKIRKCAALPEDMKPIGIAHHGEVTDRLWRAGKLDLIKSFINKVHDLGFAAGISTHNPAVVEAAEERGWSNDFYMTCFYCESRLPEEFLKEIGVVPVGETYLSSDPPRMCQVIRQTQKTCLGFKILAAGRKCRSPEEVRQAFEFSFKNIKPRDAVIVGMYPRYSDQISENAGFVREFAA